MQNDDGLLPWLAILTLILQRATRFLRLKTSTNGLKVLLHVRGKQIEEPYDDPTARYAKLNAEVL